MALDAAKAGFLLFVVTIVQVTILNTLTLFGGTPDLLLVTLVAVSLLRGSIFGAAIGFFAGLLFDTATLQTLGVTSLLLTLAGYWTGRYGETTGRDKTHAPVVSVAVATVLYAMAALALRFVLAQDTPARAVLVDGLLPGLVLNLLLAAPVAALCGRMFATPTTAERTGEVRLLG
jgi:rod shape-determining protein MreD